MRQFSWKQKQTSSRDKWSAGRSLVIEKWQLLCSWGHFKGHPGKKKVSRRLRARIWAELFSALADKGEPWPSLSHENLFINESIREYSEFNMSIWVSLRRFWSTCGSVGQFLVCELSDFEESKDNTILLLYRILAHFLYETRDNIWNTLLKGSSVTKCKFWQTI